MPGADSYPEGTTALVTDSPQRSLVKICSLVASVGGGGGGGGTQEVFSLSGSDTPTTAPTSGNGKAYNAIGQEWNYVGGAWQQTIG